jgi:hypothetical protein
MHQRVFFVCVDELGFIVTEMFVKTGFGGVVRLYSVWGFAEKNFSGNVFVHLTILLVEPEVGVKDAS